MKVSRVSTIEYRGDDGSRVAFDAPSKQWFSFDKNALQVGSSKTAREALALIAVGVVAPPAAVAVADAAATEPVIK